MNGSSFKKRVFLQKGDSFVFKSKFVLPRIFPNFSTENSIVNRNSKFVYHLDSSSTLSHSQRNTFYNGSRWRSHTAKCNCSVYVH